MNDRFARLLLGLATLFFAAFIAVSAAQAVFGVHAHSAVRDTVLFAAVPITGGAALVVRNRGRQAGTERLILGVALWCFAAGSLFDTLVNYALDEVPFPSVADACYLGFYLLVIVVVGRTIRSTRTGRESGVWLDAAIAVLGCASITLVAAGVLVPNGATTRDVIITMMYPALDAALLALAVSAHVLDGMKLNRLSGFFVASVLALLMADTAYALDLFAYVEGGVLDILWLFGVLGLANAGLGHLATSAKSDHVNTRLALPGLAASAAAVVLVWDHFEPTNHLAVGLAVATLLLTALRTFRSNRTLRALWHAQVEARSDSLTGLPNRRALVEELDAAVAVGEPFVCLTLDLNGFKEINDALGHAAGDAVLQKVARRLSMIDGAAAPFRAGGDEFIFVLPGTAVLAEELAERLHRALAPVMHAGGTEVSVSASLGYAAWPGDTVSLDELQSFSDTAMYEAKRSGRRVVAYGSRADVPKTLRFKLLHELRTQIERGNVRLEYQPQVDLADLSVFGVEALARFHSETLGPVSPAVFIPVIESAGLMAEFTALVLRQAVDDALQWQRRGVFVQLSVNVSVSCLHSETFVEMIHAELAERCRELHRPLVIELTEEAMMYEVSEVLPVLRAIREAGCLVAMDDFGKGYSSVARLRQLPIDVLKLDKQLIDGDPDDAEVQAVVTAVVQLGAALGITTLAEGVETVEQLQMIRAAGVTKCQGFYFARSMPASDLCGWVLERAALEHSGLDQAPT